MYLQLLVIVWLTGWLLAVIDAAWLLRDIRQWRRPILSECVLAVAGACFSWPLVVPLVACMMALRWLSAPYDPGRRRFRRCMMISSAVAAVILLVMVSLAILSMLDSAN